VLEENSFSLDYIIRQQALAQAQLLEETKAQVRSIE